jgi:hypothetical protein
LCAISMTSPFRYFASGHANQIIASEDRASRLHIIALPRV